MSYAECMEKFRKHRSDAELALIRVQILEELGQSTQAKASAACVRNSLEMAVQSLKELIDEIDHMIDN